MYGLNVDVPVDEDKDASADGPRARMHAPDSCLAVEKVPADFARSKLVDLAPQVAGFLKLVLSEPDASRRFARFQGSYLDFR